jgi:hypothetical protein
MLIITEANGTISKSFKKYLNNITGKLNTSELQKTAILALHTYFEKY